jgi:DNA-binding NarL/FixJ family response regulator
MTSRSRVAVLGDRPLRTAAVERALAARGIEVTSLEAEQPAELLVLLTPGPATWESVRRHGWPVVAVVDTEPDSGDLVGLVEHGAQAIVVRDCPVEDMLDAIEAVGSGVSGLSPRQVWAMSEELRRRARGAASPLVLTDRETQILAAIAHGLSVKQTAVQLGISPKTVENTQRPLFRKLGVRNRSQAVARAIEAGLLGAQA